MAAVLEVRLQADQFVAEAMRVQAIGDTMFAGAKQGARDFGSFISGGQGPLQALYNIGAAAGIAAVALRGPGEAFSFLRVSATAFTAVSFAQGGALNALLAMAALNKELRPAISATARAQGSLNNQVRSGAASAALMAGALTRTEAGAQRMERAISNAAFGLPVLSGLLSQTQRALRRTATASATMQTQLGTAGTSINNLSIALDKLAPTAARVASAVGIAAIIVAVTALTTAFFRAVGGAISFESAMVRLQTQVGLTSSATEELGDANRRLAREYGLAARQISDVSLAVTSGGLRAQQAIEATAEAGKLVALGFGDAVRVGRLFASVLVNFNKDGLTASQVADQLARGIQAGNFAAAEITTTIGQSLPFARQLGIEFSELIGFIASYTQSGVSAAIANTALRQTMLQLVRPSNEAKKIIEEAGGSYEQLRNIIAGSDGLVGGLTYLRDTLGLTDDQLARVIGSGEALSFVFDATSEGSAERYRKNIDDIANSAGTTDEALDALASTVDFKWNKATAQANEILLKMGNVVLPIINAALWVVNTALTAVIDSVEWLADNWNWNFLIPGYDIYIGAKALWDWAFGADAAAAAGTDLTHDMDSLREEMMAAAPPTQQQVKNLTDMANEAFHADGRMRSFNKQIEDGIHPLQASANVLAGTTTAVDALKDSADDAELSIRDFNAALSEMRTDRARREMFALAVATQAAAAAAQGLDPFIAGQEALDRFAQLHTLIETRLGIIDAAKRLISGESELDNELSGGSSGGRSAADILADQWREAERVAKQYFDNVKDQLDDQLRALNRADEDYIDLLNRQFTERFLALAETANITDDERRRLETRLRAQRDLSLAEARRENREEQRRIEDRLEREEDFRRTRAHEAADAIAFLRGRARAPLGTADDPIYTAPTGGGGGAGSGGGASGGTTGGTGAGGGTGSGGGAGGGVGAPAVPPTLPCGGDPNYATFQSAAAVFRAQGFTPPAPNCDALPQQINGMRIAITRRQQERAAQAARLAAVQGTQGAPQIGDPNIGPPGGGGGGGGTDDREIGDQHGGGNRPMTAAEFRQLDRTLSQIEKNTRRTADQTDDREIGDQHAGSRSRTGHGGVFWQRQNEVR